MGTSMLVTRNPQETMVALVEDGRLVELWAERSGLRDMVGDIYTGVVQTILPGMDAAFVELGLQRAGYLHAADLAGVRAVGGDATSPRSSIEGLRQGQRILVQVTRNPAGSKGPRLSGVIALPGRYAVLVPEGTSVGVSRRIREDAERARLLAIGAQVVPAGMGLIMRTMAADVEPPLIEADVRRLVAQWNAIRERYAAAKAPSLLARAEPVVLGAVRDAFGPAVDRLLVDDTTVYEALVGHMLTLCPALRTRIELYELRIPLLEYFGVDREVEALNSRVVRLPRGGSLVIDQTEAMVVVDVNTGSYAGGLDQEDTVFRINCDAADEVARQLRLRDLGGIIVVDFIDMREPAHRVSVVERLRDALTRDRAHTTVLPVSDLGVVEMTRERIRPVLAHLERETCPACGGTGVVVSLVGAAQRLERRLARIKSAGEEGSTHIEVCPELEEYLVRAWGSRWDDARAAFHVVRVSGECEVGREGFRVVSRLDK